VEEVVVIAAAEVWLVVARWAARESLAENIARTESSDCAMGGVRRGGWRSGRCQR
jgi:hypothetical protein